MALFVLRELDFDKKLRITEVFNSHFYVGHSLAFSERILALVSLGLAIYIIIITVYFHSKSFLIGLKRGSSISQGVLVVMVLLFLSNFIDGFIKKLNLFGVNISATALAYFNAIEEILELGMAVIIFLTINAYFSQVKTPRTPVLSSQEGSR